MYSNRQMPTTELCYSCQGIEAAFEEIFVNSRSAYRVDDRPANSFRDGISLNCRLCPMLAQILQANIKEFPERFQNRLSHDRDKSSGKYELWCSIWGSPFIEYHLTPPQSKSNVSENVARAIGLVVEIGPCRKLHMMMRRINSFSHRGFLLPTTPVGDNPNHVVGYALNSDHVNYEMIKRWINDCQQFHRCCNEPRDLNRQLLQVIDCKNGRVITCPKNSSYLALSYVWGVQTRRERIAALLRRTLQNTKYPRTIQDAIFVTTSLGYRYLWVDKYCINQEDQKKKAAQIAMMDKIYESAEVTIVAASGDGDDSGLPGAGTIPLIPRDSQPTVHLAGYQLVWTLPALPYMIRDTTWATRGWTYQEAVLSTRCLIFTKSQVFVTCKTTTRFETIPNIPQMDLYGDFSRTYEITTATLFDTANFSQLRLPSNFNPLPKSNYDKDDSIQLFATQASTYLMRSLTYESDTLDAFLGILTRSMFSSYCGVPLIFNPDSREGDADIPGKTRTILSAFIRGLTWTVLKPSRLPKRSSMPSWAWLSVGKNEIVYKDENRIEAGYFVFFSATPGVEIWCRDERGVEWEPFSSRASTTKKIIPFFSTQLLIETRVGNVSKLEKSPENKLGAGELSYNVYITEFSPDHPGLEFFPDCRQAVNLNTANNWTNLVWKIAFLDFEAYMDPKSDGPDNPTGEKDYDAWPGMMILTSIYLVLEYAGKNTWRRVGICKFVRSSHKRLDPRIDLMKLDQEKVVMV